jgi:hypothetical protein
VGNSRAQRLKQRSIDVYASIAYAHSIDGFPSKSVRPQLSMSEPMVGGVFWLAEFSYEAGLGKRIGAFKSTEVKLQTATAPPPSGLLSQWLRHRERKWIAHLHAREGCRRHVQHDRLALGRMDLHTIYCRIDRAHRRMHDTLCIPALDVC